MLQVEMNLELKKMVFDMSYQSQSPIPRKQKVCEQGKVCANTMSS